MLCLQESREKVDMIYFGAVAVVLAAYMTWRVYSASLFGELDICRRLLAALTDYRDKIKCYMDTPKMWANEYSDEELARYGFLSCLMSGGDFLSAYSVLKESVIIGEQVDCALTECFERLGAGYLETEIEILNVVIDKLKVEEESMTEAFVGKKKAAGAVLGAVASGVVILAI